METPRWITSEQDCLYCFKYNPVSKVEISEDRQVLLVSYECKNKNCNSLKSFGRPSIFQIQYQSPGFVTQWEECLKNGWKTKPKEVES